MLYLEHSVESLARGGPWLLGMIVPGVSRWRVLKEAETEIHGGSSRRRLYGCTVTMLQARGPQQRGSGEGAESLPVVAAGGGPPTFEQLLLTWSQVNPFTPCPQIAVVSTLQISQHVLLADSHAYTIENACLCPCTPASLSDDAGRCNRRMISTTFVRLSPTTSALPRTSRAAPPPPRRRPHHHRLPVR